jgi:hypothetical protein
MQNGPTSHPAASAWLASQRNRISYLVEAGTPFLEIEEIIGRGPLPPDQKTELWTFAWSLLGPERQRQHAEWIKAAYSPDPPTERGRE